MLSMPLIQQSYTRGLCKPQVQLPNHIPEAFTNLQESQANVPVGGPCKCPPCQTLNINALSFDSEN